MVGMGRYAGVERRLRLCRLLPVRLAPAFLGWRRVAVSAGDVGVVSDSGRGCGVGGVGSAALAIVSPLRLGFVACVTTAKGARCLPECQRLVVACARTPSALEELLATRHPC
jgi:hypothetical protein